MHAAEQAELVNVAATENLHDTTVTTKWILPSASDTPLTVVYKISGAGTVEVAMILDPQQREETPLLPRFGITLAVPQDVDQIEWYGRGPHETYWDRKTSGEIALHQSTADEMPHNYARSQDTGNRTDVRWFTIATTAGPGLRVDTVDGPISFSVLPYTLDDLYAAGHQYELPRREFNTVFIDSKLHGVGGDNSWGERTHDEYTLPGNHPHELRFRLSPTK